MAATQDIVFAVLFSVVLVFNIAGNSLVIYIITNERGMKTSTNYLLLNLAVADLLFGVFLAPEFIFLPFFDHPKGTLGKWLCTLLTGSNIGWLISKTSLFIMVVLSFERYFAVCRPHQFKARFSSNIVKYLVLASWGYAILMLPLQVHQTLDEKDLKCQFKDPFLQAVSVYGIIEACCALSLMIFLLSKIYIFLWCKQTVEATGEREITERKKKKKVTLCVLAVCVTFIVCWIPDRTHLFVTGFFPDTALASNKMYFSLTVLFQSVNAALDPYLYSFQSSKFKELLKKLCFCRFPKLN